MDPQPQPEEQPSRGGVGRSRTPTWKVLYALAAVALGSTFLADPVFDRVLPAELAAAVAFKPFGLVGGWYGDPRLTEWSQWSQWDHGDHDPWGEHFYSRSQLLAGRTEYCSSGPNRTFGDADDIGVSHTRTLLVVILQDVPKLCVVACVTLFWLGLAALCVPRRFSGLIEVGVCLLISTLPGIAVGVLCPVLGSVRQLAPSLPSLLVEPEVSIGASYALVLAFAVHLVRSEAAAQDDRV